VRLVYAAIAAVAAIIFHRRLPVIMAVEAIHRERLTEGAKQMKELTQKVDDLRKRQNERDGGT
jgi:hypothetical protein